MAGPAYHGRTHLPGGTDPIPGLTTTGGPGLEDVILTQSSVGLWKLNESSGDTALDSSGNGNHVTVPSGGYIAPTWGQVAGPPGTLSALFVKEPTNEDTGSRLSRTIGSGLTDDFSAGVWVKLPNLNSQEIMGQGTAPHANSGWSLAFTGSNDKFSVIIGNATQIHVNNVAVIDTWYLFGFTRASGTSTMYLDGLAQTETSATAPPASGATWIGNDGFVTAGEHGSDATMSWAFITDTPISGAEWLEIYETGTTGGALEAGLVWTSDGAGGASWQPSQIEIEY